MRGLPVKPLPVNVRIPPRPPFERQFRRRPDGTVDRLCSLCGTVVTGRRRNWCSDLCVSTWRMIAYSSETAAQLFDLHGHTCWSCGQPGYPDPKVPWGAVLEMDHRRPLWSLTPEERTELKWWLPFNLWLICRACHRTKTRAEAADRAAGVRGGRVASNQLVMAIEIPGGPA